VFALDKPLAILARHLVEGHSLADKIDIETYPRSYITEFRTKDGGLPFEAWSSGEQQIWLFLASLAGQSEIVLSRLTALVGGGESRLAHDVVAVFAVAMGAQPNG